MTGRSFFHATSAICQVSLRTEITYCRLLTIVSQRLWLLHKRVPQDIHRVVNHIVAFIPPKPKSGCSFLDSECNDMNKQAQESSEVHTIFFVLVSPRLLSRRTPTDEETGKATLHANPQVSQVLKYQH
jgi:hypothetical protein